MGWETIEELIQYETQIMVFKSVNGLAPKYLADLFVANSTNYSYNLRSTALDCRLPMKMS